VAGTAGEREAEAVSEAPAASRLDVADGALIGSVSKALRTLSLFSTDHPAWSLQDMRRALGLPKTMTYRLARTLEYEGFIALDEGSGTYHLGPSMIPFVSLVRSQAELTRIAKPYLEDLVEKTEESSLLAVEVYDEIVVVEQVSTPHFFKPANPALWLVVDNLGNACAKVFAAFRSESERDRILSRPQEKLTEATITDPDELRAELDRVRREGVAFDIEEQSRHVCAVVAPVLDHEGRPLAGIGIIAPSDRFQPEVRPRYAQLVREAAEELSRYYGHGG
jgi:DNA-binding IclR family transcriptional regulator